MSEAMTIQLSLIAHTNAGKTTLARTLLGRDVGEVREGDRRRYETAWAREREGRRTFAELRVGEDVPALHLHQQRCVPDPRDGGLAAVAQQGDRGRVCGQAFEIGDQILVGSQVQSARFDERRGRAPGDEQARHRAPGGLQPARGLVGHGGAHAVSEEGEIRHRGLRQQPRHHRSR